MSHKESVRLYGAKMPSTPTAEYALNVMRNAYESQRPFLTLGVMKTNVASVDVVKTMQYCLSQWLREERHENAAYVSEKGRPLILVGLNSAVHRAQVEKKIISSLEASPSIVEAMGGKLIESPNGVEISKIERMIQTFTNDGTFVTVDHWIHYTHESMGLLLETMGARTAYRESAATVVQKAYESGEQPIVPGQPFHPNN